MNKKIIERKIDEFDLSNINENDLKCLINVFRSTSDHAIIHKIALIFADIHRKYILDILIEKVCELRDSDYISTLLYACSEHYPVEYANLFVDLMLESSNTARYHILGVLTNIINKVSEEDKLIIKDKLRKKSFLIEHGEVTNDDLLGDIEYLEDIMEE